jgi:hypothetical protein
LFFRDGILIFLNESFRVVADIKSVMTNREARLSKSRFFIKSFMLGRSKVLIKFVDPGLIGSCEETTFLQLKLQGQHLIEKGENA